MYISNLKLWNFRKFGSDVEFQIGSDPSLNLDLTKGLNVIIGENDSGKTAIIDAIKLVLKTHSFDYIRVEDKDFYKSTSRFRIELLISDLNPNEAKNFTEWLSVVGEGADAKPFLKLIYDVKRQGKRIFPSDVRAGADDDAHILNAEAKDFLKATYLKPLRDAENELIAKRNSRLSQILLGDSAFKGKEKDHELVKIFGVLGEKLKQYFKGEFEIDSFDDDGQPIIIRPQDGKLIKDTIDKYIKGFYGSEYETGFEATSTDIKSILEKLTLILQEEANPGLGTLNRLFMATELLHLNKENWTGLRLGLIEELEAHLHPQAQMQVIEALQNQQSIQLVLTTHSPNLASKLKLENLIICNNGKAFPMGPGYTKLDPDDYIFLEKFLDVTKSNLFFAKGLILVEGWAEEIIVPSLAKSVGINLTERGVSVVNVGNLAFTRYANIFLRSKGPDMDVPIAVITDSDFAEYKRAKNEEGKYVLTKIDAETILKGSTEKITELQSKSEKNVQYFIAPEWTLEYSISKSKSLSQEFQAVTKSKHTGTDWDSDFEAALAEKLLNKGFAKTEVAYLLANAIDLDMSLVKSEEKENREILIDASDEEDKINYLLKAIKYASRV
jgi:putative ATP-dependent endonuclease of OLD family